MAFLKDTIVPRAYQSAIAASVLSKGNTLVVLPTGIGKTLIAFIVIGEKVREGRAVFLSPTKPLVMQHCKTFLSSCNFPEEDVALITGEISPKKREELWKRHVCFSTPQSYRNDIMKGRADAKCAVCILDEAHRSVGNYAYTFVAEKCGEAGALLLGLTASPGGSKKRIEEIVAALGIKNIEIRTHYDSDVAPYIQSLNVEHMRVPLGSEFSEIRALLSSMLKQYAETLESFGPPVPVKSKRGLVELRMKIMRMSEGVRYNALSFYSTVFNLVHMLELIETQGLATFLSYVEKLRQRPETKARRRIFTDRRFIAALELCKTASEHPKMAKLLEILSSHKTEKSLIFAQYRDQVQKIVETLRQNGIPAERFVGKKEGVTSDEQKRTIERFAKGEFLAMVATSIGEEGLDIPAVDNVIFFEPIPSEIRSIQRRGRAGRLQPGKVFVLITTGTRDEAYFYSSKKKEENMGRIVRRMQRGFSAATTVQAAEKEKGAVQAQKEKQQAQKKSSQKKKRGTPVQKKMTDF